MLQVEFLSDDGSIRQMQAPDESILGKAVGCEVRLAGWRIGREHARLSRTPGGILLEDLGTFAGLAVDGRRIDGQYGPLKPHEVIEIRVVESGRRCFSRHHREVMGKGANGQPSVA